MDKESVQLIDLDGRERLIPRDKIRFVVIHNTFENPIKQIKASTSVKSRMKKVFVESSDRLAFVGWPIKFIENLVVFYDTRGRQHVLELNNILRLRPYKSEMSQLSLKASKPKLGYGDSIGVCQNELGGKSGTIPTRILGDQIQISEFLNNFEKGYERVNSYQERTYLYAKPFLFPEETKLGITLYQKPFANPLDDDIPIFFQWATGRPYRFQSFTQIGYVPVEYLPTVEPLLLARSEVKSHFFRGSFVGNLQALPAGSEYYTPFERDEGRVFNPQTTRSGVAVNYMALMGGDYENWTLQLGSAYFTYYIQVESYFREILGSAVTPVLQMKYTGKKWDFFAIYGQTDLGADAPNDLQLSFDPSDSVVGIIESFDFESRYVRGGTTYHFNKKTQMGANFLYLDAKYSESLAASRNFFNWNSKDLQVFFHKQFGEYVALKVFANSIHFDYDSEISSQDKGGTFNEFLSGGSFEFIF